MPGATLPPQPGHKRRLKAFTADDRSGAYVHCGVREHVMGSMANGMAAHGGIIALSVTYLAFSDYQRPAMRMAALMGLPVKFVFSHDSIGVGKNGPTHQPVEILASLRAMPNMLVMRPADAVEATECWEAALEHRDGPVTLVFARQTLAPVRRTHVAENLSRRGAYLLAEAEGGVRRVTLLGTGSEVSLALAAFPDHAAGHRGGGEAPYPIPELNAGCRHAQRRAPRRRSPASSASSTTRSTTSRARAWGSLADQLMDNIENFVAGRPSNLVQGAY